MQVVNNNFQIIQRSAGVNGLTLFSVCGLLMRMNPLMLKADLRFSNFVSKIA